MALEMIPGPRVLYLDDESDLCSLVRETFGAQDIEAVTFMDPAKALEDVQANYYDAVIVDYHLKHGKNGIDDFLRPAKKYVKGARLFVFSVDDNNSIGRDADEVGALYVVKSGNFVAFASTIGRQIKNKLLLPTDEPQAFY